MNKKTKFNLVAGIGTISLILLAILGPRININFGTKPAEAQVPPGCVAITASVQVVGGGGNGLGGTSPSCSAWGTATCSWGQIICPAGSTKRKTGDTHSGGLNNCNGSNTCWDWYICVN